MSISSTDSTLLARDLLIFHYLSEFHLCLSDIDMSEALFHLRTSTKACVIALGRAFGVFVAAVSRFTLRVSLSIRVCVAGDSLK